MRYNGRLVSVPMSERLDLLVETLKHELGRVPVRFEVKMIQLCYNVNTCKDGLCEFEAKQEEDVTSIVAI